MGIATLATAGTMAFAQSTDSSVSSSAASAADPGACSAALELQFAAMATVIDRRSALEKSNLAARLAALKTALALTDDEARAASLQASHESEHETMKAEMEKIHAGMQKEMDAVRGACGDLLPGKKMGGMFMMKHGGPGMHRGKRLFQAPAPAPDESAALSL